MRDYIADRKWKIEGLDLKIKKCRFLALFFLEIVNLINTFAIIFRCEEPALADRPPVSAFLSLLPAAAAVDKRIETF